MGISTSVCSLKWLWIDALLVHVFVRSIVYAFMG